jgi:hypothetical protein
VEVSHSRENVSFKVMQRGIGGHIRPFKVDFDTKIFSIVLSTTVGFFG